jgi:predicted ATP-dependent serine protease
MDEKQDAKAAVPKAVKHSDQVEILRDIKVPEKFYKRIKFDIQVLDEIFGGQDFPGILPGTSILFTGMPGAGKSTAALQLSDVLQKVAGQNILYNVGEENEFMVKLRADRLGIEGNFALSKFEDVNDLINYCKETGVEVLFQDSLQSLTDREYYDTEGKSLWKVIGKKLHKFAKDTDITIFVIGHITKGGDFAGPMELKHDLDAHLHLRLNPETMSRELMFTKNRFGPAGIPYECSLTAKGLDFLNAKMGEPPKEGGDVGGGGGGKAGERREAVAKLIKEQLLKGEKISGYCYTRFPDPFTKQMGVNVSGGFWRTMLEKVCQQLKAEGHVIGDRIINGRHHSFVEI